ncbi:MAG: hypothetical protein II754_01980 [Lachnospiraceae bacterium]|nr:hypothetical protein [Lachnospiraceae bacterium]
MSDRNHEINKEQEAPVLIKQEEAPEAFTTRMEGSYVPGRQRYLKAHTSTGYNLQGDYKSWSLGMLRDALDRADYRVVGRTFQGSRTRTWEKQNGRNREKNKHSELMTPIIRCIDRLTQIQSKRIDPETAEKDLEELKNIYNDIFQHAYVYCSKRGSIWPEGKARKDMVLLIRDQANEERMRLANNTRAMVDEVRQNPQAGFTYGDAIKSIRTTSIRLGENGVTSITGGGKGTSELIVVEKNGKKLYIRKSENLKKDSLGPDAFFDDCYQETKQRINELAGNDSPEAAKERKGLQEDLKIQDIFRKELAVFSNDPEEREQADALIRMLWHGDILDLPRIFTDILRKNPNFSILFPGIAKLFREAAEDASYRELCETKERIQEDNERRLKEISEEIVKLSKKQPLDKAGMQEIQELEKERVDLVDNRMNESRRLEQEFRKKDTLLLHLKRAVSTVGKRLNQRSFARKIAKIPDGANVSNRNVAVSILARALGMEDIVAESEMVEVEIDGKKIHGVVMHEAEGGIITTTATKKRKEGGKVRYSPRVLKDLSRLHLADILWGQVDRKADNYMTKFTEKEDGTSEASSIMAIDNDMSCGLLDYEEDILYCNTSTKEVSGFRQELPAISSRAHSDLLLEAVDADFARRILALQPSFIDFLMLGILTPPEINAMKKRLVAIQKILKHRISLEKSGKARRSVFMHSEKDWEGFRDYIEENGHEKHSYYQNIYEIKRKGMQVGGKKGKK